MASKYWFDRKAAAQAELFFETFLVHTKGEWANKRFVLEQWQRKFIRNLFGWKRRSDGTRRYRTTYLEIPRKNGKSHLCSGIALYMLFADGEQGAEVYSAAADRHQAHIVFDVAKEMVLRNAELHERANCYRTSISVPATASKYESLSSDAFTKLGLNPHAVIFDEIAIQPNDELYNALRSGQGARRQPLLVMLTTAGVADRESIGWRLGDYARKVRDGIIADETFYPVIYETRKEADWKDPKVWERANPNYGVSVKPEFLAEECETAKASPAAQNVFRRFYLDQWVEQTDRYIDMSVWDQCIELGEPEDLLHYPCFAALDLGSVSDLSSLILLFPPEDEEQLWEVLPFFWVPADNIRKRVEKDRVPYDDWVSDGLILTTPGEVTDQDFIRHHIGEVAGMYEIQKLGIDPWNAQQLAVQLESDGHTVEFFRQGFASMANPTKELLALLIEARIRVGSNPVLRWMASNMTVKMDPAGNVKPDKGAATEKIDGMVALIMALGLSLAEEIETNVYEERAEAGEELLRWV